MRWAFAGIYLRLRPCVSPSLQFIHTLVKFMRYFPRKTDLRSERLLFPSDGEAVKHLTVRRPLLVCVLGLSAFFGGLASSAPAQSQAGSISGTLMDSADAVLRGAQVSIPAKGLFVSTDEQGRFSLVDYNPATTRFPSATSASRI